LYVGADGVQLYCNPVAENQYCTLSFPGQALASMGVECWLRGYVALCQSEWRWNVTRCDFAFDTTDFHAADIYEAAAQGNITTRVQRKSITRTDNVPGDGYTCYVGAPSSDARIRAYRKVIPASMAFGDEPFTRVELQLRAERADMGCREVFAGSMEGWAAAAAGLLCGFFKVELDWWRDWVASIRASWVRIRRAVPTVASIEGWLVRQVTPALACWLGAKTAGDTELMPHYLRYLLQDGAKRLTAVHKSLMQGYNGDLVEKYAVYGL
jgi:hypothetical protein